MNQNNFFDYNNSSSFVDYSDYTSTSTNNYNDVFRIIFVKNVINESSFNKPNVITNLAIFEARNHFLLKEHETIVDFFDDLEK